MTAAWLEASERKPSQETIFDKATFTSKAREVAGNYPALAERLSLFEEGRLPLRGSEVWMLIPGSDQHLQILHDQEKQQISRPLRSRMLQFLHVGAS